MTAMNFPVEQHLRFYSPIVLLNRPGMRGPGRNKLQTFHGSDACIYPSPAAFAILAKRRLISDQMPALSK